MEDDLILTLLNYQKIMLETTILENVTFCFRVAFHLCELQYMGKKVISNNKQYVNASLIR